MAGEGRLKRSWALPSFAFALSGVPRNLLLRFKNDDIDESNALATILQVGIKVWT